MLRSSNFAKSSFEISITVELLKRDSLTRFKSDNDFRNVDVIAGV